jgi:hypothetical protein
MAYECFGQFSGLHAWLDSEQYSWAMPDFAKNLHRITTALCHSEVHGNLMKVFDHDLQSKGPDLVNILECGRQM